MQTKNGEWWKNFFDDTYLSLYGGNISGPRAVKEVDFLVSNTFRASTKTVCDAPCGFGRHAELLAVRGYMVTGIDASKAMIREANGRRKKLSKTVAKNLSYSTANLITTPLPLKHDAVICMFTSFGYFGAKQDERMLKNLCEGVAEKGRLIIDLSNPSAIANAIRSTGKKQRNGSWRRTQSFDDAKEVEVAVLETLRPNRKFSLRFTVTKGKKKSTKNASWRLYTHSEMRNMLTKNGFSIKQTFGDFAATPYAKKSPRMILVAERKS